MRIAIDVLALDQPFATGVEKTLLQLLASLDALGGDDEFFLVAPKRPRLLPAELGPRFHVVELAPRGRGLLWRERRVPPFAHRDRIDVWHSPVQAIPLLLDRPKVATVHELSWLETRGVGDEGLRTVRRMQSLVVARAADRIVCVSRRTRDNFLCLHPRAEDRTLVLHHGVDPRFRDAVPRREHLEKTYGIPAGQPYLLTLGRALKRKGLPRAVRAFRVLLDRTGGSYLLVMAGPDNSCLREAAAGADRLDLSHRVILPGYVAEEDLPSLYAGAAAFLLPSESEGFGLPLLEAMAAGTPVVANRAAALPEVAGQGARLADFRHPAQVCAALLEVLGPDREAWIDRGRKRAEEFPADLPARFLLDLWHEMAVEKTR